MNFTETFNLAERVIQKLTADKKLLALRNPGDPRMPKPKASAKTAPRRIQMRAPRPEDVFRHPPAGGKTAPELVRPGDIVEARFTACGKPIKTGPYTVEEIIGPYQEIPFTLEIEISDEQAEALRKKAPLQFSLRCSRPDRPLSKCWEHSFWLNELIAVDGRILSAFLDDDAEIQILKRSGEFYQPALFTAGKG